MQNKSGKFVNTFPFHVQLSMSCTNQPSQPPNLPKHAADPPTSPPTNQPTFRPTTQPTHTSNQPFHSTHPNPATPSSVRHHDVGVLQCLAAGCSKGGATCCCKGGAPCCAAMAGCPVSVAGCCTTMAGCCATMAGKRSSPGGPNTMSTWGTTFLQNSLPNRFPGARSNDFRKIGF